MNHQATFNGYVLSVLDTKKICVRIDKDDIERISDCLTFLCDKATAKDTVAVNVKDAKFAISIPWNELTDLIGTHIKINCMFRKYKYYRKKNIYDENNERVENRHVHIHCVGVTIIAKRISNVLS